MADDNNNLERHKVIAFAKNVDLVGQQLKSRLVSYVDADMAWSEAGDRYTDELMGISDPVEVFQDIGDSPSGEVDKFRRWAFFKTFEDGKFVGTREKAEQLVDPTNPTVQAMGAGRERRRDYTIINGLFAPAYYTNAAGEIKSLAFPGTPVAVNSWAYYKGKADGGAAPTGNTGLTTSKLREALVLLDNSNIMTVRNPVCAVEQRDLMHLLTSTEVTSADYNAVRALVNGEINSFMGIDFAKVNRGRILLDGSGYGRIPIWYPDQIAYKERPLTTTRIVERADKRFRWYAYYEAQDSVLRRQDGAVAEILCAR
jgi:hypothetical protein